MNKQEYKKLRDKGLPAMSCKYGYNELIQRGLVLAIQNDSYCIVEYPTAIKRRLSFDTMSLTNFVRIQSRKRFGKEIF